MARNSDALSNQREYWTFDVPTEHLRERSNTKLQHHRERMAHYKGEAEKARTAYIESIHKAAENATEHETKAAQEYANMLANTGGGKFMSTMPAPHAKAVQGDPELHQKLQDAHAKVAEHKGQADTYYMWVNLLKHTDQSHLPLTIADARFFALD